MIVVDEKASAKLHPKEKRQELKSKELAHQASSTALTVAASGSEPTSSKNQGAGRRSFGAVIVDNLIDIILGISMLTGIAAVGALALTMTIANQQNSLMEIYAQRISTTVDHRGAELPASTEVSGEFSDVTGGTVRFKDPKTGKVVASVPVAAEPTYGDATRSFEVHGTVDDYKVDFSNSKNSSVAYHFDPDTSEVTKTTESKGL